MTYQYFQNSEKKKPNIFLNMRVFQIFALFLIVFLNVDINMNKKNKIFCFAQNLQLNKIIMYTNNYYQLLIYQYYYWVKPNQKFGVASGYWKGGRLHPVEPPLPYIHLWVGGYTCDNRTNEEEIFKDRVIVMSPWAL